MEYKIVVANYIDDIIFQLVDYAGFLVPRLPLGPRPATVSTTLSSLFKFNKIGQWSEVAAVKCERSAIGNRVRHSVVARARSRRT